MSPHALAATQLQAMGGELARVLGVRSSSVSRAVTRGENLL